MARFLVVDDDTDVGDLVALWLRSEGHQVFVADGAGAALTLVDGHGAPDVLVLDVAMPGLDGVDLLARLRSRFGRLPAVFLTVVWSAHDLARIRAAGGEYLPKPCTADELRVVVHRLLGDMPGVGSVGSV